MFFCITVQRIMDPEGQEQTHIVVFVGKVGFNRAEMSLDAEPRLAHQASTVCAAISGVCTHNPHILPHDTQLPLAFVHTLYIQ